MSSLSVSLSMLTLFFKKLSSVVLLRKLSQLTRHVLMQLRLRKLNVLVLLQRVKLLTLRQLWRVTLKQLAACMTSSLLLRCNFSQYEV